MLPGTRLASKTVRCVGTSQGLAKRVIACLDVRANDAGDLVVTKGDQYEVRDKGTAANDVRNLGLPVQLAGRYFVEGADEVTFLNITGFRDFPLGDLPMLEVGHWTITALCHSLGCHPLSLFPFFIQTCTNKFSTAQWWSRWNFVS